VSPDLENTLPGRIRVREGSGWVAVAPDVGGEVPGFLLPSMRDECESVLQSESSTAVANGVVHEGSDDDNVYALNAKTGAKLWSFATGNHVVGGYHF
jgi:outer membrane protein assembly factor BamB